MTVAYAGSIEVSPSSTSSSPRMNALLLPIVRGFLLLLEAKALPARFRMRGPYRFVVTGACLVVMLFGLYMVPASIHF